jgi:hypothetical protein
VTDAPIAPVPRPETTPEEELSALAAVYRFILDCHARKGAAPASRPDDGTAVKEESADARS